MRPKFALATALVGLAVLAPAALAQDDPVDESPFGGQLPPPLERPSSQTPPPPGFASSARMTSEAPAARIASRAEIAKPGGGVVWELGRSSGGGS